MCQAGEGFDQLPPPGLLARARGRAERDDIGVEAAPPRRAQQLERLLPLQGLLAGADGSVVRDEVGGELAPPHLPQQPQRARPFLALLAGADRGVVGDPIGLRALASHGWATDDAVFCEECC